MNDPVAAGFAFLSAAQRLLAQHYHADGLPRIEFPVAEMGPSGRLHVFMADRVQLFRDADEPWRSALAIPEGGAFFEALVAAGVLESGSEQIQDAGSAPTSFQITLSQILHQYLNRTRSLEPDEVEARAVLDRWITSWRAGEVGGATRALLPSFSYVGEPCQLSSHLRLERTTTSEIEPFLNPWTWLDPPLDLHSLRSTKWHLHADFLVAPTEYRKAEARVLDEIHEELELVLSAFRLLHPGPIGMVGPVTVIDAPELDGHRSQRLMKHFGTAPGLPPTLHFDAATLADVRTLIEPLAKALKAPGFALALRRFNASYVRDAPEDQLLDLTICLEAGLLAGTQGGAFRLSLLAATLVSSRRSARTASELAQTLYRVRNKIVHEGQTLSGLRPGDLRGLSEANFLTEVQGLVRDVLRELISRLATVGSLAQVRRDLEASMLRS